MEKPSVEIRDGEFGLEGGWCDAQGTIAIMQLLDDPDPDPDMSVSHLISLDKELGRWRVIHSTSWIASRVVRDLSGNIFLTGPEGQTEVLQVSGDAYLESVPAEPDGPQFSGPLTNIALFEDSPVICGMSRRVYRRSGSGIWTPIDEGMFQQNEDIEPIGLMAICEFGSNELVAVGHGGEMWTYRNGTWNFLASPTNIVLTDVCDDGKGGFLSCGQLGVIVQGTSDQALLRAVDEIEEDLWGCAMFHDSLFLATESELFYLDDGRLNSIDTAGDEHEYNQLVSTAGELWSFGEQTVLSTKDGKNWIDYSPRQGEFSWD